MVANCLDHGPYLRLFCCIFYFCSDYFILLFSYHVINSFNFNVAWVLGMCDLTIFEKSRASLMLCGSVVIITTLLMCRRGVVTERNSRSQICNNVVSAVYSPRFQEIGTVYGRNKTAYLGRPGTRTYTLTAQVRPANIKIKIIFAGTIGEQ